MEGPFRMLDGHEQVVYGSDPQTGMRCIIAIYSTALGPALGGTRFYPYTSENDALVDVLRLSRAMAYKAACAGLDLGGGKAVILGDPARDKSEALLRAYGRVVESLSGRYVTACDVGTSPGDLAVVARETRWATGADAVEGGSGDSGIMTAYGTYVGMRACAERVWGSPSLGNRHVAVQGLGKVGRRLAEKLHADGAKLTVADVDDTATAWCAERLGADVVSGDKIHAIDADVFSPNALGGVIDDGALAELQCRIVAGAANNQLAEARHGDALTVAGILYAPDYVVNAGGLIQVADELQPGGYRLERVRARTERIADRLHEVLTLAETERLSTAAAADRFAERRMAAVGRLRRFWLPPR
ncbi:Glu/Leu/Phe/Val dehydrogenase dimerization domain-containing protein [soil metagenome]|nr:Glu/Leu/Phe/Val dehydrogenase [Euzebyaceae bacterium]